MVIKTLINTLIIFTGCKKNIALFIQSLPKLPEEQLCAYARETDSCQVNLLFLTSKMFFFFFSPARLTEVSVCIQYTKS